MTEQASLVAEQEPEAASGPPAADQGKRARELAAKVAPKTWAEQDPGGEAGQSLAAIPPLRPEPAALATQDGVGKLPAWGVGESWLAEYERIAVRVAGAVTLPDALVEDRNHNPYPSSLVAKNVLTVALAGRELGIGFMESLRQIHIIKGQTALSAELKMALAKRDGLMVDAVDESNGCKITAHRRDTGEKGEGKFTPEDKKLAKLGVAADSGWDKYPSDMYWARASARLIRRLMPDAKGASFRSVEEISDEAVPE